MTALMKRVNIEVRSNRQVSGSTERRINGNKWRKAVGLLIGLSWPIAECRLTDGYITKLSVRLQPVAPPR